MNLERVMYALAKQVPAMRNEVTLHTSYGDIVLCDEEAARVAAVVEKIMQRRCRRLQATSAKAAK